MLCGQFEEEILGRKSRDRRVELEWLHNYGREATGIIIDLCKLVPELPEDVKKRINRLKMASALWDEIKRKKEVFVP